MQTKYLKHFNHHLKRFREAQKLGHSDISMLCLIDVSVARAWELEADEQRCYPSLENLLDLCLKTGAPLEQFVDLPDSSDSKQLDLPGLSLKGSDDLTNTLEKLDQELEKLIPGKQEMELLRRFRNSDKENRELILQLIGN